MSDVEFFFDPVCPWAWITSRWVEEVASQRQLDVAWRFIALRIVNEAKDYDRDFPKGYTEVHGTGLKMLRVCAAARAAGADPAAGNAEVARLYARFGTDLHVERRRPEIMAAYDEGFPDYLRAVGLAEPLVAAAQDPAWDGVIREETEEALARTGRDVGTPIISFDGQSFFGPVMSRVPRGADALRLWDAVWTVATFPGMAELKRSLREPPQTAT